MTRIGIIEDLEIDANSRYGHLNESLHQIHLLMLGILPETREDSNYLLESQGKFDLGRIYYALEDLPQDLDIYFCDGLCGKCFLMADKIGKLRTIIRTSNISLHAQAKRDGYRILSVDKNFLDKFLEELQES